MGTRLPLGMNLKNGVSYKAVVVDDSSMMRKLLCQILRSESFEVIAEYENGESIVGDYEDLVKRPDFAFVDIEMPGINGVETVTQLKAIDPQLKYVMCTGVTDREVVKELLKLGISGYIVKPFDRDKVIERLAPILGRTLIY